MNKTISILKPTTSGRAVRQLRTPHSEFRTGFTLIEMLVVIAIIGLLAALIVTGAGIASTKMRRARVEAEREQIIGAIEQYKKAKGFYPPDNSVTNNGAYYTYQNSLFYELTGTTAVGDPTTGLSFKSSVSGESLSATTVTSYFNTGGFLNSSADPTAVVNFFVGLKGNQHSVIGGPASALSANGVSFSVLGVEVPGPVELTTTTTTSGARYVNPWRYVVSNPTHNNGSYDLWMDVLWAGHTNRVSNWKTDPEVVSY